MRRLLSSTSGGPAPPRYGKSMYRTSGMPEIIERWSRARFQALAAAWLGMSAVVGATASWPGWGAIVGVPGVLFLVTGMRDMSQRSHTILRNFPVLGRVRYLLESVRPEIRQYFVEADQEAAPFSREQRALVYQRAKGDVDSNPFGTRRDVYKEGYEFMTHSMFPAPVTLKPEEVRVTFGTGPEVKQPYSAALLNVSAMSFGAISNHAVLALNGGAKLGNFYTNTGEGGVSRFHLQNGGDVVWNIGSGLFGCRLSNGRFDAPRFRATATDARIKMIEIKLSQGAKPGHGGVLPASKLTPEIAQARGVSMGEDCVSPSRHPEFSTPHGLLEFAARLREESGGKPVGIKMCVGHVSEAAALVHAMLETKLPLDFITVDGGEGGTGAAPPEYSNHVGMPLNEGMYVVHNLLVGAGLRPRTRVIASGKVVSGFSLFRALCLGADTANAARGFMLALGCIQSLKCHTNKCPTGVATQDPALIDGLDVTDKTYRVFNFQRKTVEAALDLMASGGYTSMSQLNSDLVQVRSSTGACASLRDLYPPLMPGELLGRGGGKGNKERERSSEKPSPRTRLLEAWG